MYTVIINGFYMGPTCRKLTSIGIIIKQVLHCLLNRAINKLVGTPNNWQQ